MYKVTVYYRHEGAEKCHFITLYGVYLDAEMLNWISNYPNLQYILVDKLDEKSK